ncbi:MAG: hypothetical protein ABL986_07835 [Vicinamibacterales bacterium]
MTIDQWLARAVADLDRRQLSELRPVLEALARATVGLRAATWNADASARDERRPAGDDR